MRKKCSLFLKRSAAAVLSFAMTVTGFAGVSLAASAADAPQPAKVVDFSGGIRNYISIPDFNDEAEYGAVTTVDKVHVKKTEDQKASSNEKLDGNGFVYEGDGSNAHYYETVTSNQPGTYYDSQKGNVLVLGDTIYVESLVKEKSAGSGGDAANDSAAAATLDDAFKINSEFQKAYRSISGLDIDNPFMDADGDLTLTYWAYIPEKTDQNAAVISFDDMFAPASATLYFDPALGTGKWTQFAVVFKESGAEFYVNGAAASEEYMTLTGDYDMGIFTIPVAVTVGGAKTIPDVDTVYDTRVDDISFYTEALSADQIQALYTEESAKIGVAADVTKPDARALLNNASQVKDVGTGSVSFEEAQINGNKVKVAHVAGNKDANTKTGFSVVNNPFKGQVLNGATVGFWFKVGSDNANAVANPMNMVFFDTRKEIYDPKSEKDPISNCSWLYMTNNLNAVFSEGGNFEAAKSLKNTFTFGLSTAESEKATQASADWQYVTLSMTCNGIEVYVNGEKLENGAADKYGTRFCDGFFTNLMDRSDPTKLNGKFGATNNQGANLLTGFLGFADTDLYFGWSPEDGPSGETRSSQTSESWYYSLSCFKSALTETEVKALYEKELEDLKNPPAPDVTPGDVDGSGKVEVADAIMVLKSLVKLVTLDETQAAAANVAGSADVAVDDAITILKYLVKLVPQLPVQ